MEKREKIKSTYLWDYRIDYASFKDFIASLDEAVRQKSPKTLLAMNTLKLHLGETNPELRKVFQRFDYITCDGQSMVWALRLLQGIRTNHLSGVEVMIALIQLANEKGYSIFFLGSPQELLDKVQNKISSEFPGISKVGFQNGYYSKSEESAVVEKIATFQPDFLFVAFGSPRKEEFIQRYKTQLNSLVMMGVGGSFEVFVGEKKVDGLTKKLGLRWFVRMAQDPKRLFMRYYTCNTFFAKKLIESLISGQSSR
jgi:N-acetylglucosaminyldiphosphoundecaprenol N-acetyl-beta-D-mannosaminyltransferase